MVYYPCSGKEFLGELKEMGYNEIDIIQSHDFLSARYFSESVYITQTKRNKVLEMLKNNDAPKVNNG